ncbi:enoyl-CoA hydratase/isomerase family protein [Parafrankia sp. EUN1f]|uniref:enoyl-CoA hydratase/isomerase family protein n=1 Tax=Parafrankia sp. EUN1f TaxID=102897 RepID=UPI0001C46FBF|nr:enoyl-CoA hydratase-related protein [Parafrankia sp. EUN1f]EFC86754.1 Enoyl-CoA hydratase/isomerase [Parafrankia sp. EUN1f]
MAPIGITTHDNGRTDIILTRPDLLNRVDDELRDALIAAFREVSVDGTTRCVVLGAQGRVFSAGGDMEMMKAKHGDLAAIHRGTDAGRRLIDTLFNTPVPVVAAVHGHAVGLGSTLVLACDAVVAARGVRIVDSHVAIGLVAGDGGAVMWPAAMGMVKAKRHLLTGDPLLAEDAAALGVVSDLVETPEEVLPTARALADRIAALPPLAVQGTKRSLNHVMRLRAEEVLELSFAYEAETMSSQDLLEGIAAFIEKRSPKYSGR